jgi:type VI protein secretion system component VasA
MIRERFEAEAGVLWGRLQELGERSPLERLYSRDADGRVARLVQSAAFAFGAARARLEDDGQALVRPLVARALSESLRPRPSSTILALSGAGIQSRTGQGAAFAAHVGGVRLAFQVAWPTLVAPIAIEDVRMDRVDARHQVLRFALRGRAGVALGAALPPIVRLFVHLEPRSVALDLVHALRSAHGGQAKWVDGKGAVLADRALATRAIRWVRADTDEPPLVSARPDRFASSTLLRDLFAFPESFCFFDLELGGSMERRAERVEVALPLAHVIAEAEAITSKHLRLFCVPATNQYVAPIEPVRSPEASEARLGVAGKPHAEILEVRGLSVISGRDAWRRTPLVSWEAPGTPHTFDPAETYYALEQRPAVAADRTGLFALFGRLDGFPGPVGGAVEGEVLACDGALTRTLGLADVGSPHDGVTNITRVTPSRRALLGTNHAWRMSAYARMPAARFADCRRLGEFFALHDPHGPADEAVRITRPGWSSAEHTREHDLDGGALRWGDAFAVETAGGAGTPGELWLLGELLSRALSERSEALRFSRLSLRRGGAPFAEYAPRPGARFPFPLG